MFFRLLVIVSFSNKYKGYAQKLELPAICNPGKNNKINFSGIFYI
jgi:hypothetical protein